MKNLIICELDGVLTKHWQDTKDDEHGCDFSYIESAIRNLKTLVEETNSILVIADDLEMWGREDLYNERRVSDFKKQGLNIDDCLKIDWQYDYFDSIPDVAAKEDICLSSLINKFISSKNYDIHRVAYIKQGDPVKKLNPIGDGIYKLSLFNKKGLTKEFTKSIKHFLLNGYRVSNSFKYVIAHKEDVGFPYDLLILSKPYEYAYPRIYLIKDNEHFPILIDLNAQFLGKEPALFGTEKKEVLTLVQEYYYSFKKHWQGKTTDKYLSDRLAGLPWGGYKRMEHHRKIKGFK